jgi:hypothetical protein
MLSAWIGIASAVGILFLGAVPAPVAAPGDCVLLGCKAAVDLPPSDSCAHRLVTWSIDIDPDAGGIKHGACHCPNQECAVKDPSCSISGVSVTVKVKDAANDIVVGGLNFGDSFTWSPGGTLSGCGNTNFEVLTVTGPGVSCQFVIIQRCRTCGYDC